MILNQHIYALSQLKKNNQNDPLTPKAPPRQTNTAEVPPEAVSSSLSISPRGRSNSNIRSASDVGNGQGVPCFCEKNFAQLWKFMLQVVILVRMSSFHE